MKKKHFLISLIIFSLITGIFFGYKTYNYPLDKIKETKTIRVGTTGDYLPMSYYRQDTNEYVGFDIELVEMLAQELNVEIEYVQTSWPTLMEDTLNNKFDIAICGITITEDRKQKALMSDAYLNNGKTILTRIEDIDKYQSLDDINKPEVRVMVNPGGLNEKFAKENLPNSTLIIHENNAEIPFLIGDGEADIMITEIMEAAYYINVDDRIAAPLIDKPFTHGQIGILIPPKYNSVLNYVNKYIQTIKDNGQLDELINKYNFIQ